MLEGPQEHILTEIFERHQAPARRMPAGQYALDRSLRNQTYQPGVKREHDNPCSLTVSGGQNLLHLFKALDTSGEAAQNAFPSITRRHLLSDPDPDRFQGSSDRGELFA